MIDQETEGVMIEHGQAPVEIVLDVSDTDFISDELYDMLLEAFVAKAEAMGYDIVENDHLVLGDWTIKAKLEEV
jgi:hypothetical protein